LHSFFPGPHLPNPVCSLIGGVGLPENYRRRSRREQQLAITAYVTRMGIMGNLLPD